MLAPTQPLPDSLRANEAGTFTEDSVVRRLPVIARLAKENHPDPDRQRLIDDLVDEIAQGVVAAIDEPLAPDAEDWSGYVAPFLGMTWRDVPWFFVETYFYRRLLAAAGYSQPGHHSGRDPFAEQKAIGLEGAAPLAVRLGQVIDELPILLAASLWANRVDLSMWPDSIQEGTARTAEILGLNRTERLLVDDTERAGELLAPGAGNIHIVLDNAGSELLADLALAVHFLESGNRVTLHAKPHPTFVSDATIADVETTVARLDSEPEPASSMGRTLRDARHAGALCLTTHPFWVSPLPFWQCPSDLIDELAAADLVFIKGDANYRRLLGDRHWDFTTPISSIVRPLQPVVALRTAKSLVVAGLDPETAHRASSTDPEWLTNGEWGMIQLIDEID